MEWQAQRVFDAAAPCAADLDKIFAEPKHHYMDNVPNSGTGRRCRRGAASGMVQRGLFSIAHTCKSAVGQRRGEPQFEGGTQHSGTL